MKIKSLTLYKTLLDSEYTNVIDGGLRSSLSNKTLKTTIFDAYYSPRVIYNTDNNIKSTKQSDGVMTVVIDIPYDTILNEGFNYAIINDGATNFYFFIVSGSSLNDGQTPSCSILLKRDAWCNNIGQITDHTEKDRNMVVRSHMERVWTPGDNTFRANHIMSNDVTNIRMEDSIIYDQTSLVVWVGFRLSPDAYAGTTDESRTQLKNMSGMLGFAPSELACPVFYVPLCIASLESDATLSYSYNLTFNGTTMSNSVTDVKNRVNFFSDIFLEAFITTTPPFHYSLSGSSITVNGSFTSTAILYDTDGTPVYNTGMTVRYCSAGPDNSNVTTSGSYTYMSPMDNFTADDSTGSLYFDPFAKYEDVLYLEPRIYTTPFVRLQFNYGSFSEEYNTPFRPIAHSYKIDRKYSTSPFIYTYLDGKLRGFSPTQSVGRLPTTPNKWDSFLTSALINTAQSTISGAMVGGWAGAAGGAVGGLLSAGAQAATIATTTTQPQVPSTLAGNNVPLLFPHYRVSVWKDQSDVEDICGKCFVYGYTFPRVASVFSNCRVWFDYCQTEECNLANFTNYLDRKELEQAFNRGLTKWHYDKDFGFSQYFDKKINNPERKYISAEDAQIAFDFTDTDRPFENKGTLGNTITMDSRTGTYTLTENGVKLTANTSAKLASTANISNFISMGERTNSHVLLFKITEADSYSLSQNNIIGLSASNKFVKCDSAGALAYGPTFHVATFRDMGINIEKAVGKTIAISFFYNGYAATNVRVFVDGVMTVETGTTSSGGEWPPNYIASIGGASNAGVTISRMKMYFYPGENKLWTEEDAQKHLI